LRSRLPIVLITLVGALAGFFLLAPDSIAHASSAAPSAPTTPTNAGGSHEVLDLIVEGIQYGAILAMTAIGLSLIFGTTGLINFAHGELVTFGAIIAYAFNASVGLNLIPAAAVAVVIAGGFGWILYTVLWHPLERRKTGLVQLFIISIGLSLLLRNAYEVGFGSSPRSYLQYNLQPKHHYGPIFITPRDLIITIASLVILVLVALMLQRTRIGKATRAVADNRDLAEASGINVNRVVRFIWILGTALAGLGGILYGLTEIVSFNMGFLLLLLIFAGIILGGLGTAYGAMLGCLIVGLVIQLSTLFFSVELQNAWALAILILVLIVRPQGLLGRKERVG
jgi:branched-chain amino acid transport system permease protein